MRDKLAAGAALLASFFAFAEIAYAVPAIEIEVFDNLVLQGTIVGPITGGGPVNGSFIDPFFGGISVLSIGAPSTTDPAFETSITVETAGLNVGHTLVIEATQINLTGAGYSQLASTFSYHGLNPAGLRILTGTNYVDPGNGAFALTTQIATTGNQAGDPAYNSPTIFGTSPSSLFSETEVWTMAFTGPAEVQASATIVGQQVPEPLSLTLLASGLIGLGAIRARRRG